MRISYPKGELLGKVRYCVYREFGYFLGIEFESAPNGRRIISGHSICSIPGAW